MSEVSPQEPQQTQDEMVDPKTFADRFSKLKAQANEGVDKAIEFVSEHRRGLMMVGVSAALLGAGGIALAEEECEDDVPTPTPISEDLPSLGGRQTESDGGGIGGMICIPEQDGASAYWGRFDELEGRANSGEAFSWFGKDYKVEKIEGGGYRCTAVGDSSSEDNPPAGESECVAPEGFEFIKFGGELPDTGIHREGGFGGISVWRTGPINTELSVSPTGRIAGASLNEEINQWEIWRTDLRNLDEREVVGSGKVGNPAIGLNGETAYEDYADSDGVTDLVIVMSDGEKRRLESAEQSFWYTDQDNLTQLGFIRDGDIYSYDPVSRETRLLSAFGGEKTQAQIVNGVLQYTEINRAAADNVEYDPASGQYVAVKEGAILDTNIILQDVDTGGYKAIIRGASQGSFSENGQLLAYINEGNVWVYNLELNEYTLLMVPPEGAVAINPTIICNTEVSVGYESKLGMNETLPDSSERGIYVAYYSPDSDGPKSVYRPDPRDQKSWGQRPLNASESQDRRMWSEVEAARIEQYMRAYSLAHPDGGPS